MRILVVGNHARPVGGAETMLLDGVRLLREAGHEVRVLALGTDGGPPPPAGRFAAVWSRPAAAATDRLLARWRPDVAHVHHVYEGLTLSVVAALQRAGVPVVMTLHDYRPVCPNYRLFRAGGPCERCLRPSRRPVEVARLGCLEGPRLRSVAAAAEAAFAGPIHRRVAAFVAPSTYLRDRVVAGGLPAGKVTVLPNPVRPGPPRPAPPDRPRFGYIGRLVDEKGLDTLLDAAALLPPGAAVDVYGDGRMTGRIGDRVAAQRLPVTVHGRIAPADVPAALHRLTAAVLPALWPENCPLALLEAAACAVPAIASRVGGIPEIVADGRTGLLVPPGDPRALAAAMAGLGPARSARLGAAARADAVARHAPGDYLTRLEALLTRPRTPIPV
ncbi:MAG TPA: glycosyltransferase [Mycobacteriales bacterium]